MWAGITETGLFSRSDTPPGGRQVITRRQRYTSGVLGFWLGWCGLILVIVVDSSQTRGGAMKSVERDKLDTQRREE